MREKELSTYIENLKFNSNNLRDIITVEHRSNNPKRDYLFVNKLQCKHIPSSPSKFIDTCNELADLVYPSIKDYKVLVIGFAETATAIGNFIGERLGNCDTVLHTTREQVDGKQLITFEEEHSHATTQKLYVSEDFELDSYNYILFVEDEISTGNTIINFIKAFNKNIKFGVASICNWQNEKDKKRFSDMGIDTFSLITGELKDVNAKMNIEPIEFNINFNLNTLNTYKTINNLIRFDIERKENIYNNCDDNFEEIIKQLKDYNTIRIIGTEEFMHSSIRLGRKLEKLGKTVYCHSTTRSKIDVTQGDTITTRVELPSAYELNRSTYLYNIDFSTDAVVIVTDTKNKKQLNKLIFALKRVLKVNCGKINIYHYTRR